MIPPGNFYQCFSGGSTKTLRSFFFHKILHDTFQTFTMEFFFSDIPIAIPSEISPEVPSENSPEALPLVPPDVSPEVSTGVF